MSSVEISSRSKSIVWLIYLAGGSYFALHLLDTIILRQPFIGYTLPSFRIFDYALQDQSMRFPRQWIYHTFSKVLLLSTRSTDIVMTHATTLFSNEWKRAAHRVSTCTQISPRSDHSSLSPKPSSKTPSVQSPVQKDIWDWSYRTSSFPSYGLHVMKTFNCRKKHLDTFLVQARIKALVWVSRGHCIMRDTRPHPGFFVLENWCVD